MGLNEAQKQERSEYLEGHLKITECSQQKAFAFISYASDNWETVFKSAVVPLQTQYGLRVYADKAFDKVNDRWIVPMLRNINAADVMIAFISQSYIESYACFLEFLTAVNKQKTIVFVMLEENLHLGATTDQPDMEQGVKDMIFKQGENIATNTNNTSSVMMRAAKSAYTSISTLMDQNALSKYDISDAFINFFRDAAINKKTINDLNALAGSIDSVSHNVFDRSLIAAPAAAAVSAPVNSVPTYQPPVQRAAPVYHEPAQQSAPAFDVPTQEAPPITHKPHQPVPAYQPPEQPAEPAYQPPEQPAEPAHKPPVQQSAPEYKPVSEAVLRDREPAQRPVSEYKPAERTGPTFKPPVQRPVSAYKPPVQQSGSAGQRPVQPIQPDLQTGTTPAGIPMGTVPPNAAQNGAQNTPPRSGTAEWKDNPKTLSWIGLVLGVLSFILTVTPAALLALPCCIAGLLACLKSRKLEKSKLATVALILNGFMAVLLVLVIVAVLGT